MTREEFKEGAMIYPGKHKDSIWLVKENCIVSVPVGEPVRYTILNDSEFKLYGFFFGIITVRFEDYTLVNKP